MDDLKEPEIVRYLIIGNQDERALKVLEDAGLVTKEEDGYSIHYDVITLLTSKESGDTITIAPEGVAPFEVEIP